MKAKKVVQYVKDHKDLLIGGAGVLLAGIIGYNIFKEYQGLKAISAVLPSTDYESIGVGSACKAFSMPGTGFTYVSVDAIDISDMGKLGEELLKVKPDIKTAWTLTAFAIDKVEPEIKTTWTTTTF